MQIEGKFIDDLKTERKDISPPLPIYLRLVPILFYLSLLAGILLNGLFALQLANSTRVKDVAMGELREYRQKLTEVENERKGLEAEVKKASDIASWMESARPLQPLIVKIARSMEADFSIIDLRLDRDADQSAQLQLNLRLGGESTQQLDLTLDQIASEKYRTFTPQQSIARGEIEYKATLIWQANSPGTSPEATATP